MSAPIMPMRSIRNPSLQIDHGNGGHAQQNTEPAARRKFFPEQQHGAQRHAHNDAALYKREQVAGIHAPGQPGEQQIAAHRAARQKHGGKSVLAQQRGAVRPRPRGSLPAAPDTPARSRPAAVQKPTSIRPAASAPAVAFCWDFCTTAHSPLHRKVSAHSVSQRGSGFCAPPRRDVQAPERGQEQRHGCGKRESERFAEQRTPANAGTSMLAEK